MQVLYEILLSVCFLGGVVELPKVRVVENTVYPLILGADWIDLSGACVKSKDRCLTVQFDNVPDETPQPLKSVFKSIPMQRSKISPCARTRTPLSSIFEDPEETSSNEERRTTKPTYLAAIHIQQTPEEKLNPAILIDNIFVLPSAITFTSAKFDSPGEYLVDSQYSAKPGYNWLIPSCLVKSNGNSVKIPVINLSERTLRCNSGKKISIVRVFDSEEDSCIFDSSTEISVQSMTSSIVTECTDHWKEVFKK